MAATTILYPGFLDKRRAVVSPATPALIENVRSNSVLLGGLTRSPRHFSQSLCCSVVPDWEAIFSSLLDHKVGCLLSLESVVEFVDLARIVGEFPDLLSCLIE